VPGASVSKQFFADKRTNLKEFKVFETFFTDPVRKKYRVWSKIIMYPGSSQSESDWPPRTINSQYPSEKNGVENQNQHPNNKIQLHPLKT